MQSLSNVIKKTNVIDLGNKEVFTLCLNNIENIIEEKSTPAEEIIAEPDTRLEDALREAETIIEKSKIEAEKAYREACEKGYRDGFKKGMESAAAEAEIRNKTAADKIEALYSKALLQYDKYLKEKENDIKKLIIKIARKILKRELEFSDCLNGIITDALNQEQGGRIIIRCNEKYCSSLRNKVESWKRETGNNLDVFIIDDISINENTAILIKEDGRAILDIDITIENFGKIILGEM